MRSCRRLAPLATTTDQFLLKNLSGRTLQGGFLHDLENRCDRCARATRNPAMAQDTCQRATRLRMSRTRKLFGTPLTKPSTGPVRE